MDTCQINKSFFKNKLFKGVFPCDQLPLLTNEKLPFGIIVNTHPGYKPGEHWVAIFVNKNKHAEYFDSFAKPPVNEFIVKFIERHTKSSCYNIVRVQNEFSEKCGQFAIGFLKAKFSGFTSDQFLSLFNQDNLSYNDELIEKFIKNCRAYKFVAENEDCQHSS